MGSVQTILPTSTRLNSPSQDAPAHIPRPGPGACHLCIPSGRAPLHSTYMHGQLPQQQPCRPPLPSTIRPGSTPAAPRVRLQRPSHESTPLPQLLHNLDRHVHTDKRHRPARHRPYIGTPCPGASTSSSWWVARSTPRRRVQPRMQGWRSPQTARNAWSDRP